MASQSPCYVWLAMKIDSKRYLQKSKVRRIQTAAHRQNKIIVSSSAFNLIKIRIYFDFILILFEAVKPRYVRVNTNLMSRVEAMEAFITDGWIEVKCENYDEFLNAIADLKDEEFISDLHVKDLFIFPASSKRYAHFSKLNLNERFVPYRVKTLTFPNFSH